MGKVTDKLPRTVEKNEKRKFDWNVPSEYGLGRRCNRLRAQAANDNPYP
jgi:hypothetical protein